MNKKTGPLFPSSGSPLKHETVGNCNNFLDLQKVCVEIKCRKQNVDGTDLRYDAGDPTNTDAKVFVQKILHCLSTDFTVSVNGIKNLFCSGHYARKSFIETQFPHGKDAKNTWLKCQDYEYNANPTAVANELKDKRKQAARESAQLPFMENLLRISFCSCEKHLVSGVSLRVSFRRSRVDIATIGEAAGQNYLVNLDEAKLLVGKMTVSDNVVGAIEKTL